MIWYRKSFQNSVWVNKNTRFINLVLNEKYENIYKIVSIR
jgi:hypothetical protein